VHFLRTGERLNETIAKRARRVWRSRSKSTWPRPSVWPCRA